MRKIIIIISIILPFISSAQNLNGVVFGNEEGGKTTLPGVNIYWQGTKRGVVSSDDGNFEIKKGNNQHMLVFSFVGYETKVVHVDNLDKLEVVLEPNLELEEVTVVKKDRGTYLSAMETIHTERIGSAELHKAACCNPVVLLNLINNAFYAVKAPLPPQGGLKNDQIEYRPTVIVSTFYLPPSGGMRGALTGGAVLISVRDNGSGIPAHIVDKIFQPFFTTKPTGQGTGLGLSLSYDIVKAHGGELRVETKEGKGSTFILILPA